MPETASNLLIGAHTSTAGGLYHALLEGQSIGATTIQLFTSNQRQWKGRTLTAEILDIWFKSLEETALQAIMSHASYLINLGTPSPEVLQKSREAFKQEIERCLSLKITFLNFHPGAALQEDKTACLDCIVDSLLEVAPLVKGSSLTLLIENTAGQGSSVGHSLEQLSYLIQRTKNHLPVGICIDTCHLFCAGYDIRTQSGWNQFLKAFDQLIGLSYLKAFHLNDSMKPLGSRRDRHAPLGRGEIGLECFHVLMTDPRTRTLPKYLETPEGPPLWKEEIQLLRKLAKNPS